MKLTSLLLSAYLLLSTASVCDYCGVEPITYIDDETVLCEGCYMHLVPPAKIRY
jgi:hypothetical protein